MVVNTTHPMKNHITAHDMDKLENQSVIVQLPVDKQFTITIRTYATEGVAELRVFKHGKGLFGNVEQNVTALLFASQRRKLQTGCFSPHQWVEATTENIIEAHRLIQLGAA